MTTWAWGTGSKSPVQDATGHQPGEMGHIDHEGGAHLVSDLPHDSEVDQARVGRVTGHHDERAEPLGQAPHLGIVDQPGTGVGPIAALVEHFP